MNDVALFRVLGTAAILGGACRIASALIPYSEAPWLLLLYLSVDVFLLFGLMGIYFAHRARVGVFGLIGFAIAEGGIASIVGPDTVVNGFETYMIGVAIIGVGMTLFGAALLIGRAGAIWAPLCWILSAVVGVALEISSPLGLGFLIGGVLFGLGFVVAGAALWSRGDAA